MIVQHNEISFLDREGQDLLLSRCKNLRYRFIILLMLRCGLRVSETITLKWNQFNFQQKTLRVRSLKKRASAKRDYRDVPLSEEVVECAAEYWKKKKPSSQSEFLFPTKSKKGHVSRQAVDEKLKSLMPHLSAHKLRHTFATEQVISGTDLLVVRELLGHDDIRTTQIYTHIPKEQLQLAIAKTESSRLSFLQKMRARFFPTRAVHVLPLAEGITNFHVGRKEEMELLHDLIQKRVNVLLLGKQGIGKSHLLDNLRIEKCLRLDEFGSVKKTLAGLLLSLKDGDKEQVMELFLKNRSLDQYVIRENNRALTQMLIQITQPKEYTILIDDVSRITSAGISALEKLKNHFHVVCAARQIKVEKATFLTNFQKIDLQPLNRRESIEMIELLSHNFENRIENYELFKNHIWNNTAGNPLYIIEMVERYQKEQSITIEVIRSLSHNTALRDIDMTLVFVVLLSSFMVMRYVGGEIGSDSGAFKLIGGLAFVFALFARYFYSASRRKYI